MVLTANHASYDPTKVLKDPKFRVVPPGEKTPKDANIAAFYNPQHEVHLVEKPKPSPGPGQVLIHVRATGICGCVPLLCSPPCRSQGMVGWKGWGD